MYFEAENIVKRFGEKVIEFSIEAEKNEFVSIVGESGAGKSTVLRIIAGLDESDSGETRIVLDGNDVTHLEAGKRDVGMMFQTSSLFMNMNVQDNIAFGLVCKGMKKKDARRIASEYLDKFNLSGFEKRNVSTLSGGEAQRVSLARTLVTKPKLLLLDEPLSALDAPLRKKLAMEIRRMQQDEKFTAIMVTHDLEEAKSVSDRIVELRIRN